MRFFLPLSLLALLLIFPALSFAQGPAEIEEALHGGLPLGADVKNINAFYAMRRDAPAWQLEPGTAPQVAASFVQYIRVVLHEHGIGEEHYPLQLFLRKAAQNDPRALAEADVLATQMIMRLAKSLSGQDPIPQNDPDHVWPLRRPAVDLAHELETAVDRHEVPSWLQSLAPHYPQYRKLKEALAQYRAIESKGGWIKLIPGYRLMMDQRSPQVPLLAQRLWQEGYLPHEAVQYANAVYTPQIAEAVRNFQVAHGLITDGNIGAQTLLALNIGVKERIDEIRANMARMRVTPPEGWDGIIINIPSFRLILYRDSEEIYSAPVVVGRPDRASPLVSSSINEMIINPAWYVPQSIAEKDILPKLHDHPELLDELNMEGPRDGGDSVSDGTFMQKPGPDNSLGRVKFNFPNRFSVYLHGTPHVELFERDDRRQSSGCVRLKKPEELAEIIMGNSPDWSEVRIQERIDTMKTMHIAPRVKMPIKLLYWTTMVNSQGHVEFYNDVYQLDDAWLALL